MKQINLSKLRSFGLILALALIYLALSQKALPPRVELTFDNVQEIQTLDPATATGQPEGRILNFLFEGLTVAHPKTLEPLPGVAESWQIAPDYKYFRFQLRKDAKWSNGDPVTAHDFVQSWQRLLRLETASPYAYLLYPIRNAQKFASERNAAPEQLGLKAPDPWTLEVLLERPIPYFLQLTYYFPLFPVPIAAIQYWQEKQPSTWQFTWIRAENLVNNGPFLLTQRRTQDRLSFEKNPYYWDRANVALNSVEALLLNAASTRLNLFESKQLAWTQQPPIGIVPDLIKRDQRRLAKHQDQHGCNNACPEFHALYRNQPFLATYFYYCNVQQPPLNDVRVRKALSMSIDKGAIVQFITRAGEIPADSFVPPLIPGYVPAKTPEYDPDHARELLAQAGYPNGRDFPVLEILYNTAELHRDIAEVIQAQWTENLGITIRLVNQEWKTFLDAQLTHQYFISRGSWIGDFRDPISFLELFQSANPNNRSGFASSEFDHFLQQAEREADPNRRFLLLQQAETIIMQQMPVIPIYFYVASNLVSPQLQGWYHNALDLHPPKFWQLQPAQEE